MKKIALLAALSLGVAGCGVNSPLFEQDGALFGAKAKRKTAKWTIAIHLAADNNLYRFGLEDVNEMEAGLSSDDVNVIVLFDGAKKGDSAILKVKRDPNGMNSQWVSEVVDDGGAVIPASKEIDSGDAKTAEKFANWTVKNYPAEHYMIAYWDHGNGIFAQGNQFFSKGIAWDDNGSHMTTADVGNVLASMSRTAGKPIDILGFDACLMAHVELAYQVKGNVNLMVASEELEPGAGWAYHDWLKHVNGGSTPAQVASSLVNTFGRSYEPGGSQNPGGRKNEVTLSATDVNVLTRELVPAMNDLAGKMGAGLSRDKAALSNARNKTENYYNSDCADLGHFAKMLQGEPGVSEDVKASARRVLAAVDKAVVSEYHTGKAIKVGVRNASGLVVYFPKVGQKYNARYDNPAEIAFAAEGWKDFLKPFAQR